MSESAALDRESEHVREVYAHYGLAMYWAQCLEHSIFQHLLFVEHFPEAVASYTTADAWAQGFDRYEAREMSQTMGRLIRRLHEAGQPTEDLEELLPEALKSRNWLAHGYFADRAIQFTLPEGRDSMISELGELREVFQECSARLDATTLPLARKFGLTDEKLAEVEAEMVAEYIRSRSGD